MSHEQQVLSPRAGTISTEHAQARLQHWAKVQALAEPRYQVLILRLLDVWEEANRIYYGGAMIWPYILLTEPSVPKRLGDCGRMTAWGEEAPQIRIRPSLLTGTHPRMVDGNHDKEGRFRFVADVLIHEQIHQWQNEIAGKHEDSYRGHGPTFCAKANEIGKALGLSPVIVRNRTGKPPMPICSHWPHNVRPDDYYLGSYVPAGGDKDE